MARAAGKGFATNIFFAGLVQVLLLLQNLLIPRLLGPENIGLFALVLAVIGVGQQLKRMNVDEKLVQDRHTDLPLAYSNAFTLELLLASGLFVATVAAAPLAGRLLDRPELTWLIVVLALTIFTDALVGLPSALYLRELRYFAQNVVQTSGTVVGVVVSVALAFAGAGVWSLAAGALAAMAVTAVLLVRTMPFAPRLRLDGVIVREYLRYGWPLWTAGLLGLVSTWGGSIVITSTLGVVALGYFTLADGIGRRVFQLDAVLAKTLFPVLTRAQHDEAGQRQAFEAVTRLSVIWAATIGFGMAVFAREVVLVVLGRDWLPAVFLLRMQGLAVTIGSVGFSWDVFFRARGETRPTLVRHVIGEGWVFVILLPAVAFAGLDGAGWAILGLGLLALVVRQLYVQRIFPGINLLAMAWRELAVTGGAAAAMWAVSDLLGRPDGAAALGAQAAAYVALVAAGIALVDGSFLRKLVRSARGHLGVVVVPPVPSGIGPPSGGDIDEDLVIDPTGSIVPSPHPADARLRGRVATPGQHPLQGAAAQDGRLWVTMRDSSLLGLFDPVAEEWTTWRLPLWPHVPCVDDRGRAWVALTLSSAVACVDPASPAWTRRRVGRSRELLVACWAHGSCWVADSGRRALVEVGPTSTSSRPLPAGVIRPDFVVPAPSGALWVTDTVAPALVRVARDGTMDLVPVPDGTRMGVVHGTTLWVGHTSVPAVTALDSSSGQLLRTVELPGVPFGLCVDDRGRTWCAFPALDAVGVLDADGVTQVVATGEGSAPTSITWIGSSGYVTCSGTAELVTIA